ncbi:hypothetical protein EDC01DRAFT_651277 [Geopyxis carbonaria]|nr:hypothetical protein EDC01DRAFT_651277 [Geopyxis carbonaria]
MLTSPGHCPRESCHESHAVPPQLPPLLEKQRIGEERFMAQYGSATIPYKWSDGQPVFPGDPLYDSIHCQAHKAYKEEADRRKREEQELERRAHGSKPDDDNPRARKRTNTNTERPDSLAILESRPLLTNADFYDPAIHGKVTLSYWHHDLWNVKDLYNPDLTKMLLFSPHFILQDRHLEAILKVEPLCGRLDTFVAGSFNGELSPVSPGMLYKFIAALPRLRCLILDGFPRACHADENMNWHRVMQLPSLSELQILRVSGGSHLAGGLSSASLCKFLKETEWLPKLQVLGLLNQAEYVGYPQAQALTMVRTGLAVWLGNTKDNDGTIVKGGQCHQAAVRWADHEWKDPRGGRRRGSRGGRA